jgi:pyruvate,water dikinase
VPHAHTRELHELRGGDADAFGGKSASLGELIAGGIPVPSGFAVSTSAFEAFLHHHGLAEQLHAVLHGLDMHDTEAVHAAADRCAALVVAAELPGDVREEIMARYGALGDGDPPVAVRSSARGEDGAEATFAGQQETYLWVRGAGEVCDAVRDCWASLYSAPAITYRAKLGDPEADPAMGVTVQTMVDAAVSGVLFTCNPVSGDPSMVAVNASWGLGLAVVGGEVTPDDFLISKITREVVRSTINDKHVEHVPDPAGGGTVEREVEADRRSAPSLDAGQLAELADLAKTVQRHFGGHQDVEWALDRDGALHVLQARPVTTLGEAPATPPAQSAMSLLMGTFGAGQKS